MSDQFCFVPTGEVRVPVDGEWFEHKDVLGNPCIVVKREGFLTRIEYPIYRRVPFAVVLEAERQLVGYVEQILASGVLGAEDATCVALAVESVKEHGILAAAHEVGIEPKEPTK